MDKAVRAAAVLVPLLPRPSHIQVLFTRRARQLRHHPGQVSFPGGRVEPDDPGPEATAIRETGEELGIARDVIKPLGLLPEQRTISGFSIVPVVAWLPGEFELHLALDEVEEAFEVPLAFLLNAENRQKRSVLWRGKQRSFFEYRYGPHLIWGATAAILDSLRRVVSASDCDQEK